MIGAEDDEFVIEHPRFGTLKFTEVPVPEKSYRSANGFARVGRPKRRVSSGWTMLCPNCDERFSLDGQPRALYCSPRCQNEANVVRYARRKIIEYPDPDLMPDDIMYAIRIQIAHALVGGYDRNARRIPPETRVAVKERDGGLCVFCGGPGEEIDHILGSSSDLANLRLLCHDCHRSLTESRMLPHVLVDEEAPEEVDGDDEPDAARDEQFEWLMERIASDEPLLPSDADDWQSRFGAWRRQHKQRAAD